MRILYICGGIPQAVNDAMKGSVAGNSFSIALAKALNDQCGNSLSFLSTASVPAQLLDQYGWDVWPGKRCEFAKRGKRFLINELVLRRNILAYLRSLRAQYPEEELAVFVENSPFAAATACQALKRKRNLRCYSITIDTPFAGTFRGKGLRGRINRWLFMRGRRALRDFDGLISFTEDVKKDLNVDIPFCPLSIGCAEQTLENAKPANPITPEKTAVYAGTLIYYNGIRELLDAYAQLGPEYALHIYGYGPMEDQVCEAAQNFPNIHFHGRFNPEDTQKILGQYELLINPRRLDPGIENFTFPSKLINYILTGKSVLTSNFKTLPPQYRDFLYVLPALEPNAIAQQVRMIFDQPLDARQQRAKIGVQYLRQNQTYSKIAGPIIAFIKSNS